MSSQLQEFSTTGLRSTEFFAGAAKVIIAGAESTAAVALAVVAGPSRGDTFRLWLLFVW